MMPPSPISSLCTRKLLPSGRCLLQTALASAKSEQNSCIEFIFTTSSTNTAIILHRASTVITTSHSTSMPTMTIFKQMAGAVLATSLLFATSATALPTTEVSCKTCLDSISANASQDVGLSPQADPSVHCNNSSGIIVDQGNTLRLKVSAFCKSADGVSFVKEC